MSSNSASDFDRAVVSPSLLQNIDINKPFNPAFDLGMPEWTVPDDSNVAGNKRSMDPENKENGELSTPCQKKARPSLSLKKKCAPKRFSKPVTKEQFRRCS